MELQKTEQLKVFFLIARPPVQISNEIACYTLAYTQEEADKKAMEYAGKTLPKGVSFAVYPMGNAPVTDIIEKIDKPTEQTNALSNAQSFFNSLKLLRDEYIKDPKDKAAITRIVNKYGG